MTHTVLQTVLVLSFLTQLLRYGTFRFAHEAVCLSRALDGATLFHLNSRWKVEVGRVLSIFLNPSKGQPPSIPRKERNRDEGGRSEQGRYQLALGNDCMSINAIQVRVERGESNSAC